MYKLLWNNKTLEEYEYWQKQDSKTLKKINKLLEDIRRNVYKCFYSIRTTKT